MNFPAKTTAAFLVCVCGALLTTSVSAQEISDTTFFKVLTSKIDRPLEYVEDPGNAWIAILDLSENGKITEKSAGAIASGGGKVAFSWIVEKIKSDVTKSISNTQASVDKLSPEKPEDLAKLNELEPLVAALRNAVIEVENGLHKHVDSLLVASAITEHTSASSFAIFWFRDLPKLRKSLSKLHSQIKKKIAASVAATNGKMPEMTKLAASNMENLDQDKAAKSQSVRWAWAKVAEFQKYNEAKDQTHMDEATAINTWCQSVIQALPVDDQRSELENAIQGSHQALLNTLSVYLAK